MKVSKDILQKCKARDRRGQELLYRAVYPDCMRITLRYARNDEDAKAIVNNSMLKVFAKIDDFQGDHQNLGGWIKRIVVNQALDFLRKLKSFNEKIVLGDYDESLMESNDNSIESDPSYILKLLRSIPLKPSLVFNLFVIEGYSHQEIAVKLKISEANSKWLLHSARKQLQELLNKNELI